MSALAESLRFYVRTPPPVENVYLLPRPAECEIVRSFDSPAHSFEGVFPCQDFYPEFGSIEVWDGETRYYLGYVDEQTTYEDDGGQRLRLLARSAGAALLDNEAKPQIYRDVDLNMIFENHIKPHGFAAMDAEHNVFHAAYQIVKGTSEWEVLTTFYRNSNLGVAYLDDGDVVRCKLHPFTGVVHRFDNKDDGALHYTSLKVVNNRYAPISKFYIRDPDGAYSYSLNCQYPLYGIKRERYLIPTAEFMDSAHLGQSDAALRMMRAMLAKKVVTVVTPGLLKASACDHAEIQSANNWMGNLFVHQVRWRLSAAGEATTLTLVDAKYV